jgi:hypothetical protein
MINDIIPIAIAAKNIILDVILGLTNQIQATFYSTGADWLIWPALLIGAWWILLTKTTVLLKMFAVPIIAVSTYFTLFIFYKSIISI